MTADRATQPGSSDCRSQLKELLPILGLAHYPALFRSVGRLASVERYTANIRYHSVSWFVADRPLEMSASTLVAIKRTVGMNARFTQVAPDNQNILLAAGRSLNLGQAAVTGSAVTISEVSAFTTASESPQSTPEASASATGSESAASTSSVSTTSSAEAGAHSVVQRRAKRRLA